MTQNTTNLQFAWNRHSAALAKANSLNKAIVFSALSEAGITHVVVGFDGEGDQGQIDGAAAFSGDATVDFPTTTVSIHQAGYGCDELATKDMILREAVEMLCFDYLQESNSGWENDGGGFGEFQLKVAARTVELEFNARYINFVTSNHSF